MLCLRKYTFFFMGNARFGEKKLTKYLCYKENNDVLNYYYYIAVQIMC